jgi:hypothetical protein
MVDFAIIIKNLRRILVEGTMPEKLVEDLVVIYARVILSG